MTRAATEKVIQGLLAASGALNETVRVMQAEASDTVFRDYRKRTAEVMAAIYLDLVKPIVKDYPDLDPGLEEPGQKHGEG
jgi:hypothetical protein